MHLGAVPSGVIVLLTHHGPRRAAPAVFFAALFVTVAVGLPQLSFLDHSQISTTLPADAARLLAVLTTGAGIGLLVATAPHLALTREEEPGIAPTSA